MCLAAPGASPLPKGAWAGDAAPLATRPSEVRSLQLNPLGFLSACVIPPERDLTASPHRFGVLAPRGKRTVASGLGCGRGWRARRARAEKNGTQSGAGRAARDTNSGAEPETQ